MNSSPRVFVTEQKKESGKRRIIKDIARYLEPAEILNQIEQGRLWSYKTNMEFLHCRDRALIALLYLTGGRISEVLRLEKKQVDVESDDEFVILHDFRISKRRKDAIMVDHGLPRMGSLAPFTQIVLDYLKRMPRKQEKLFPISRQRAWQIVSHMTGKWCHYYRSQRLSYLVNLLRSSVVVQNMMGIKTGSTLSHYFKGEWKQHKEQLKK